MSDFGRQFEEALPGMQAVLGDSVVITLPSGTQLTRTCVSFDREAYVPDTVSNGVFHFIDDSTLGLTATTALKGATILFNGVTWTVLDPRRDEDGGWEIKCVAPELTG